MFEVHRSQAQVDNIDVIISAPVEGFDDDLDISGQRSIKNLDGVEFNIGSLLAYRARYRSTVPAIFYLVARSIALVRVNPNAAGHAPHMRMCGIDSAIDDADAHVLAGVAYETLGSRLIDWSHDSKKRSRESRRDAGVEPRVSPRTRGRAQDRTVNPRRG